MFQEAIFSRRYCNNIQKRHSVAFARKNAYSGEMKDGTRKRLTRAVTLMVQASPMRTIWNEVSKCYMMHRLSFITLTVSQKKNISAKQAYPILLKPFLRWMRETKGVKMYVWKAELQRRGQIHYHITFPDFIHYEEINKKWNELQREAGTLNDYVKEHGHYKAPSTDIHKVQNERDMAAYICKELAKTVNAKRLRAMHMIDSLIQAGEIPKEQRAKFLDEYTGQEMTTDGKIWGCSENLLGAQYFSVPLRSDMLDVINSLVEAKEAREVRGDFWAVVYLQDHAPPELLNDHEKQLFSKHMASIIEPQEPPAPMVWQPVSTTNEKEFEPYWSQAALFN